MIRFRQWQFNPENGVLSSDSAPDSGSHRLPPRLVKLLVILTQNSPHLVDKQSLITEIWQDKVVNDDALARSIAELRKLLGDNSQSPTFIETVPRRGYRFIPEVLIGPVSGESTTSEILAPQKAVFSFTFFTTGAFFLIVCLFIWLVVQQKHQQTPPLHTEVSDWQAKVDNARRFNADAQMEYQPEISPSGKQVAYGLRVGEDVVVHILDASGSVLYQIAEPGSWVMSPTWSPDEKRIAVAIADSEQCNVFAVEIPTLTRKRLSHCSMPSGSGIFDWSPDGNRVAFVGRLYDDNSQPSILLNDLDTGDFSRLTLPPGNDVFDSRPRFSADGESLFFLRGTRSARDIYRIEIAEPNKLQRITTSKNFKLGFVLSPSGNEILFDSNTYGDRNLWLVSLDDLNVKNLGARDSQLPSVSKHGQLFYQEVRYQANLWHFDLASKTSRLIVGSPKYDNHPAISPDASLIAYASNRFGRAEIWLYDQTSGQDSRLLSLDNVDLLAPVWSDEGDRLLISSRGDSGYGCYEMHIDTREVVSIDGHGMDIYSCQYQSKDRILAIDKTENAGSHMIQITPNGASRLLTQGVTKAMPLSSGDIVYSLVSEPGLHLLQVQSASTEKNQNKNKSRPLIKSFSQYRTGNWTTVGNVLYFINPQNRNELWALDLVTNEQSLLLDGLNLGVGYAIAIDHNKTFAVVSQKGDSQSNLFMTRSGE